MELDRRGVGRLRGGEPPLRRSGRRERRPERSGLDPRLPPDARARPPARLPAATRGSRSSSTFRSRPYDLFRILPWDRELLRGLLACDLVGFHFSRLRVELPRLRRAAARRARRPRARAGRARRSAPCRSAAFPLGIDYDVVREARARGAARRARPARSGSCSASIGSTTRRACPRGSAPSSACSSCIPSTASASCCSRSRSRARRGHRVPAPQARGRRAGRAASTAASARAAGRRSTTSTARCAPERLAALYRDADVALVTPLRDGMNLVAKEFVACQVERAGRAGAVALAGAAESMHEALQVNPYNVDARGRGAAPRARRSDPPSASRACARSSAASDATTCTPGSTSFLAAAASPPAIRSARAARGRRAPGSARFARGCAGRAVPRLRRNARRDRAPSRRGAALEPDARSAARLRSRARTRRSRSSAAARSKTCAATVALAAPRVRRQPRPRDRRARPASRSRIPTSATTRSERRALASALARSQAARRLGRGEGRFAHAALPRGAVRAPHAARAERRARSITHAGFQARDALCAVEARPPIGWDKGHAVLHVLRERHGPAWSEQRCASSTPATTTPTRMRSARSRVSAPRSASGAPSVRRARSGACPTWTPSRRCCAGSPSVRDRRAGGALPDCEAPAPDWYWLTRFVLLRLLTTKKDSSTGTCPPSCATSKPPRSSSRRSCASCSRAWRVTRSPERRRRSTDFPDLRERPHEPPHAAADGTWHYFGQ